jgi:hypothetical protein
MGLKTLPGPPFRTFSGDFAMSRSSLAYLLHRAHEHLIASVAAIAITTVMLLSVNAHAATHGSLTPSVTILVPSVTIELVAG